MQTDLAFFFCKRRSYKQARYFSDHSRTTTVIGFSTKSCRLTFDEKTVYT